MFMAPEVFDAMKEKYPKFYEPWTEEESEQVKLFYEDGKSIDDISQALQRTPRSVRMKLKAAGLYTPANRSRAWTTDDEETLKAMYRDGVSFEDMATQLDRSPKAVVAHLVHLRLNLFPCGQ